MSRPSGTDDNPNQTQEISHVGSSRNKRKKGLDISKSSRKKPAGNSVTDQQLNHVKMLIKQCDYSSPVPGDNDIINVYKEEKEKLRIYFEKLGCCFSLTIRKVANVKYTGFMVHFIDDDWKLKEKMIGFKCIERDQNMEVLKNVLSDLGIDHNKISSMVINCDSDIYVLSSDESSGQGSLLSNCKFCLRDFRDIDKTFPKFDAEIEKVLGDRIREIFDYISETSSKIETFQIAARSFGKEVTAEDIQEWVKKFGLVLVKITLDLKEALFELENMDPDFKSINLTKDQWDEITTFCQFCVEDNLGEIDWGYHLHRETANIYFPMLCRMYKKSLVLETLNSLVLVTRKSFICGKKILQFVREGKKCWEQSNLILAVAAVLDPRFKMDIVKHWYKKIHGDEWETQLAIFKNYFNGVYNDYAKGTNNFQSSTSGSKEKKSSISYTMLDILGYPSHDHDSGQSLDFELHLYLKYVNFPLIKEFDILEWWRDNSRYFPTLAKMARDFLSIKITVPYFDIKVFDSDIVQEAFMCTKSW